MLGAIFAVGLVTLLIMSAGNLGVPPTEASEDLVIDSDAVNARATPLSAVDPRSIPAAPGPGSAGSRTEERDEVEDAEPRYELHVYCSPTAHRLIGSRIERGFEKSHDTVDLVLHTDADRNCVGHLIVGNCEVALIGSELSYNERKYDLSVHVVGHRIVVPVTHRSNPIDPIRHSDLERIMTGKIRSWRACGWTDLNIQPACKSEPSQDDPADQMLRVRASAKNTAMFFHTPVKILDFVASNRGAIGLVNLKDVGNREDVRLPRIGGIAPTRENYGNDSWPLGTTFHATTQASPGPVVQTLLDYLRSTAARRTLRRALFVD